MLFSKRKRLEDDVINWCKSVGASPNPFNIITALDALGYLKEKSFRVFDFREHQIRIVENKPEIEKSQI